MYSINCIVVINMNQKIYVSMKKNDYDFIRMNSNVIGIIWDICICYVLH